MLSLISRNLKIAVTSILTLLFCQNLLAEVKKSQPDQEVMNSLGDEGPPTT